MAGPAMSRSRQRGGWLWWAAPTVAALGWLLWTGIESPQAATATTATTSTAAPSLVSAAPGRPSASAAQAPAPAAPFSATGLQTREAQRALWSQRLERAQATLAAYRESSRYPHESQPISAHPDQVHPNQPVTDEHALRGPGGRVNESLRLRTSQERIFVQGNETVRFTVSLVDANGQPVPLSIVRASAREIPAERTGTTYPEVPMPFNDEGTSGDVTAGDGVFSVQLQPATQGFAGLLGQIRVELLMQHREHQGATYFDVMYTPEAPATWQGGVREAMEDGSLNFYLKANVREAGRYVVTARVDDASGKPFALLTFNDEVAAGAQEFRLPLFGKLVRDGRPAFPLVLRDVDAFLLRPDVFPDRKLMPRLPGRVHTSQAYPLAGFTEADWNSEERARYVAELTRDLDDAQREVDRLGKGP
jgi:hypothetical protein